MIEACVVTGGRGLSGLTLTGPGNQGSHGATNDSLSLHRAPQIEDLVSRSELAHIFIIVCENIR